MLTRKLFAIGFLGILLAGGLALAEEPKYGGTLKVALASEPGTLDMQLTTGVAASIPARHIFEGLFAFDENYTPKPMLLESWERSPDGKTVTFHLRKGVLFHNGKELVAEDVVASLERWGKYGLTSKALWSHVQKLEAVDNYTVGMILDQPFAPLETYLANIYGGPRIYPKEVAEAAGNEPIAPENYIGTGPYKFAEWKAGDYIRLVRFDRYVAREDKPSGFAGKRTAYFDELIFYFVPEDNARLVGVQAGTYDYVVNIPNDLYPDIEGDPNIVPIIADHPPIYPMALCNTIAGLTANVKIRQAILAALDMEPIMLAGYGDPKFWKLNGSYFAPGIRWYTAAGTEAYDQADPEKAKRLLEEAGYNGEPLRLIVAGDMTAQYNQSLVVADQLKKAGFNVDLQVYDKATFFARRNDRENPQWELAFSYYYTIPDPSLVLMLSPTYAGWWDTPQKRILVEVLNQITDFKVRYKVWEAVMELWYIEVPAIKFGDAFQLHLKRAELKGYGTDYINMGAAPYFWNSWK
ncbi:ABC transporter substrate-binding protein [Candidatus Bipolaricaulota bacterium]|nr:ABC transporter substrate-binding protein [Candidatus Bipolaricaulota bacterium]